MFDKNPGWMRAASRLERLFDKARQTRGPSLPKSAARPRLIAMAFATASFASGAATITAATPYWGNSLQTQFGYTSRDDAAVGGISYWCNQNAGHFKSCTFGGLDVDNWATVVTDQYSLRLIQVFEYWMCPPGGQLFWPWNGSYGCINASAPPPPPPPPPIPVVIDPGHGFLCAAQGLPPGAVGVTDFPTNDPPAGKLQEDAIAFAIASQVQKQMPSAKYKVVLTKANANECPRYRERGRTARRVGAEVFVSVHVNAPFAALGIDVPVAHGTSVIYNSAKSGSFNLAEDMSRAVSIALGTNNRGVRVDDSITVLTKEITPMNAVLVETARLSGRDEEILHSSGSSSRAAAAIESALESFLAR
jgi:N-acetylmuramoyl-L-alanine amidase